MDQSYCVNLWQSVPPMSSWHIILVKCDVCLINVPEIMVWKLVASLLILLPQTSSTGAQWQILINPSVLCDILKCRDLKALKLASLLLSKWICWQGTGSTLWMPGSGVVEVLWFKLGLSGCYKYNINVICWYMWNDIPIMYWKKLQVAILLFFCCLFGILLCRLSAFFKTVALLFKWCEGWCHVNICVSLHVRVCGR